jgi:hypothetical protein
MSMKLILKLDIGPIRIPAEQQIIPCRNNPLIIVRPIIWGGTLK